MLAKRTRVTKTTLTTAEVGAEELRKALGLPSHARLYFTVPGGADWSNAELDLDDHPITIDIQITEESETNG